MRYFLTLLCVILSVPAWTNDNVNNSHLVNELVDAIERNYVLTQNIDTICSDLNALVTSSEFTSLNNEQDIANALTQLLKKHDAHFTVQYYPPSGSSETLKRKENWFARLQRKNSGFKRVEVLEGNVGFIDIEGFDAVSEASISTVSNAMSLIANTDAVIIDLRTNGGGSAEMVRHISSYFLPAGTHLNSIYHRPSQTRSEFRTQSAVSPHFGSDIPLYVLISRNTFSAAEEFAYNVKHLKRATVIGEPSKGGANPWQWFSLPMGFRAAIPVSMAINPITQTNWEGKGVIPHVQAKSEEAKTQAYKLALQWRKKSESNPFAMEEIANALKMMTAEKID